MVGGSGRYCVLSSKTWYPFPVVKDQISASASASASSCEKSVLAKMAATNGFGHPPPPTPSVSLTRARSHTATNYSMARVSLSLSLSPSPILHRFHPPIHPCIPHLHMHTRRRRHACFPPLCPSIRRNSFRPGPTPRLLLVKGRHAIRTEAHCLCLLLAFPALSSMRVLSLHATATAPACCGLRFRGCFLSAHRA